MKYALMFLSIYLFIPLSLSASIYLENLGFSNNNLYMLWGVYTTNSINQKNPNIPAIYLLDLSQSKLFLKTIVKEDFSLFMKQGILPKDPLSFLRLYQLTEKLKKKLKINIFNQGRLLFKNEEKKTLVFNLSLSDYMNGNTFFVELKPNFSFLNYTYQATYQLNLKISPSNIKSVLKNNFYSKDTHLSNVINISIDQIVLSPDNNYLIIVLRKSFFQNTSDLPYIFHIVNLNKYNLS